MVKVEITSETPALKPRKESSHPVFWQLPMGHVLSGIWGIKEAPGPCSLFKTKRIEPS